MDFCRSQLHYRKNRRKSPTVKKFNTCTVYVDMFCLGKSVPVFRGTAAYSITDDWLIKMYPLYMAEKVAINDIPNAIPKCLHA